MIVDARPEEVRQILGAMRRVASAGGAAPSAADRATIDAAYRYVFKGAGPLDIDALPAPSPAALAGALAEPAVAQHAARFLAVTALVDGHIDPAKIAIVLGYASALHVRGDYLRQLAEAAQGHLAWVAQDMMRQNVRSIAGLVWNADDPSGTFLPYANGRSDPALAKRYDALAALPAGTLGRAFWAHYRHNGYAFPGEPDALNEKFATPHDSTHVLSGYDTSPHGEVLVSTFTAAMHRQAPMSGHVLPVIWSWHLGLQLNPVAKSATGAFDPPAFWLAWDRGAGATADVFATDWDFWALAAEPVAELRRRYAIAPLPAGADATLPLLTP